jgi:signal transduction histidine kinase
MATARSISAVDYSPQGRVERAIATARLVFALFSLLAIGLDFDEPAKHADLTYSLLIGYASYSTVLVALVWLTRFPAVLLRLPMHALDLAIFSILMYATESWPTSPFFAYFIFALLCGTLRWQWGGAMATAAVSVVLFLGIGAYQFANDPASLDVDRLIIRAAYLSAAGGLLTFLGMYELRLRRELGKLAGWPHIVPSDLDLTVRKALAQVAAVMRAPRVLVAWHPPEQYGVRLALWSREGFRTRAESPVTLGPLVAPRLEASDFVCDDCAAEPALALTAAPSPGERWLGEPVNSSLRDRFALRKVLALRFPAESVRGRLFILDKTRMTTDDVVLGQIVARQLEAQLSEFYLLARLREAAAREERTRLARDLHDGVLQSLTGIALELEALRRSSDGALDVVRQRLQSLHDIVVGEQRGLRSFIGGLRPGAAAGMTTNAHLTYQLLAMARRAEEQWRLAVEFRGEFPVGLPPGLENELFLIFQEAVVNAGKHAGATRLTVEMKREERRLDIAITDDGHGFAFRGRYDGRALAAMQAGPRVLKERIAALGGSLTIESSERGSALHITVPLGVRAA